MREARDTRIPARDGVSLAADVFLPDADGPHPALVALAPYGKEIQSLQMPTQPPTSPVYWREIEAGDPRYLTDHGYAHVIADVRGTGRSEGTYRGWMSADEARDAYDAIEWAAARSGATATWAWRGFLLRRDPARRRGAQAAATEGDHAPQRPADYYREGSLPRRVLHTFFDFIYMVYAPAATSPTRVAASTEAELGRSASGSARTRTSAQYAGLHNTAVNPQRSPLFFDLLANPLDGPFYWERSAYRHYDRIKIPFYTGSGWWAYGHMHLRGAFQHYEGIDAPKSSSSRAESRPTRRWTRPTTPSWCAGTTTG